MWDYSPMFSRILNFVNWILDSFLATQKNSFHFIFVSHFFITIWFMKKTSKYGIGNSWNHVVSSLFDLVTALLHDFTNNKEKALVLGQIWLDQSIYFWHRANFSAIVYIAVRIHVYVIFILNIPNLQRLKLDFFMFHFMLCLW